MSDYSDIDVPFGPTSPPWARRLPISSWRSLRLALVPWARNSSIVRGSCLMTWHMPFGLGIFLVSNTSEPSYYFFFCSAPDFRVWPSYDGKSFLYDCPLMDCQLPWFDTWFINHVAGCPLGQLQLLGLSITLVWFLSYYMKVILCLNIPGRSALWSGFGALGPKIVLYSKYLRAFPCPFGSP